MPEFDDIAKATSDFLAHYGVKGMKWGVQRDEAMLRRMAGGNQIRAVGGTREERKAANAKDKQDWKDYKKNTSKQERKADRNAALASKGEYLVSQALKNPDNFVQTRDLQGMPVLMLGSEFTKKAMAGAAFNVSYTEITDMAIDRSRPKN